MNPNYGIFSTAGNARHAAYSIEQLLTNRWTHTYASIHPVLEVIRNRANFNRGFSVRGTAMLVPVVTSLAAGRTAAVSLPIDDGTPELTPRTGGETAGTTLARYEFAHLTDRIVMLNSEKVFNAGGGPRPDLLQAKLEQVMEKFRMDMSHLIGDASSGTTWGTTGNVGGARLSPLSLYCVADTDMASAGTAAQSPGQIPMGGAGNPWSVNNQAAVGTLNLPILDNALDRLLTVAPDTGDLILASNRAGGVNVFGKLRFLIGPSQLLVTQANNANYGFETFTYRGRTVVQDPRVESGNRLAILTTKNWFFGGYNAPQKSDWRAIPGTDAEEMFFTYWYGMACNHWQAQFYLNGITG